MRFLLFFVTLLLVPISVFAQDLTAEQLEEQRMHHRVEKLEKDLILVQEQLFKDDSGGVAKLSRKDRKAAPKLEVKILELEEQIRDLNGKIEENNFNYRQISQKLDKIVDDIDFRLSAFEERQKKAGVSSEESEKDDLVGKMEKTNLQETASLDTSVDQYDRAFGFLRNSQYEEAELAFKDFIKSNKDSDLVGNAYYWLGETFYVRENYEKSAVNFLKGYQNGQSGNKAADNLLKLGMSLGKLDKKKEACATFGKLSKEFPAADAAVKDKVMTEKLRMNCS